MLVQEKLEPVLDTLTKTKCTFRTPTFKLSHELMLPSLLRFLVLVDGKIRKSSRLVVG
jgi:hypothetical protein